MKPQHLGADGGDIQSIISAEEVVALIGQPNVKIFDVRGTWKSPVGARYENYLSGHIDGAVFIDWTKDFLQQGMPLNLSSVCHFEAAREAFAHLGINENDLVVIYDDNYHMFAGRIWWAMRYWGFKHVKVLNGGWKYWSAQRLPVSRRVHKYEAGSFQPICDGFLRVSLNDFLIERNRSIVIDGRGSDTYAGKAEDHRTGHIPGAINMPFKAFQSDVTGLFLDDDSIEALFNRLTPGWREGNIISSCGSGYAGTIPLLALSHLGVRARLFDGSFAVWKQQASRSIEQGKPTY